LSKNSSTGAYIHSFGFSLVNNSIFVIFMSQMN
jgi:hypothetical protein